MEWENFIQSKTIDPTQIGEETHHHYEFSLLEEFSDQQFSRYRPYAETMDRYINCRPYLENHVILSDGTMMSASVIQLARLEKNYHDFIASQAPFKHHNAAFWQMIVEQNIEQIVMLTELVEIENPSRELACSYWPETMHEKLVLENGLEVTLIEESELLSELEEYIQVRKFHLHQEGKDKLVTHYWYRYWMDMRAPRHSQTLLTLIQAVETEKNSSSSDSPILVHCSAGVGRTGVFITIYHFMQRAKYKDEKINLFDFIAYLRCQRPYLVASFLNTNFAIKSWTHR